MRKISNQKHPEGCTQLMVNVTADPPGENYDENIPAMTRHEGAYLQEASYICNLCGKNLTSYSKFMTHQEMHYTRQTFKCPECENRYKNMPALRVHLKTHTMKTPYTCTECDKSFIYRDHLLEHQKIHMAAHARSVNEAPTCKASDLETIQWSLEEKREIMYCHYYASAFRHEGYIQLLRSKLEQRGIVPLAKLQCASDSKLRTITYHVKCREYINDTDLELIKNAAKKEIAGEI